MNMGWLSRLGPGEILLIFLVIVLLFGARRIPEIARSLGRSLSEFKKGQQEGASAGKEPAASGKEEKKPSGPA